MIKESFGMVELVCGLHHVSLEGDQGKGLRLLSRTKHLGPRCKGGA